MDQVAGDDVLQGGSKPVRTKLWDRAASAGRLLGGLAQAAYYALKTWVELL
ncbi:hypothetical protein [Streptomyces sp. NPDC001292]|uniref:hypothetical protein n=1 Tax=Streptomyces sp. NPDC001292 TaxID=3364558 RepID=UPI00367A95C0